MRGTVPSERIAVIRSTICPIWPVGCDSDCFGAADCEVAMNGELLGHIDAITRPCPGCGSSLLDCYDNHAERGYIKCCPDCDHREQQ